MPYSTHHINIMSTSQQSPRPRPGQSGAPRRNELTLEKKVQVIKAAGPGVSQRALAEQFGVGKTQIGSILKRKADLLSEWEDSTAPDRKRVNTRRNTELEDQLWCWFQQARAQSINLTGPMVQEKARQLAAKLGQADFKASNGWLDRFKRYHNIHLAKVCGERASVNQGKINVLSFSSFFFIKKSQQYSRDTRQ